MLVSIQAAGYEFPFDVKLKLDREHRRPVGRADVRASASTTCSPPARSPSGKAIAGTGEIDGEGNVGPIGGIQQKLVGAQGDGAKLFLVPADNCAEALGGHYDPDKMRLVKVTTLDEAIDGREGLGQGPRREAGEVHAMSPRPRIPAERRSPTSSARSRRTPPEPAGTSPPSCSRSSTPPTCSQREPQLAELLGVEAGSAGGLTPVEQETVSGEPRGAAARRSCGRRRSPAARSWSRR